MSTLGVIIVVALPVFVLVVALVWLRARSRRWPARPRNPSYTLPRSVTRAVPRKTPSWKAASGTVPSPSSSSDDGTAHLLYTAALVDHGSAHDNSSDCGSSDSGSSDGGGCDSGGGAD
jgi:uncharacterized membrane protein YgcG